MSAFAFEWARPGSRRGPAAWWRWLSTRLGALRRGRVRIEDPYSAGPSHEVPNAETVLNEALNKIRELSRRGALDEGNGQVLDRWLQHKTLQWHAQVDMEFDTRDREAESAAQQAAAYLAWRTHNVDQLEAELNELRVAINRRYERRQAWDTGTVSDTERRRGREESARD